MAPAEGHAKMRELFKGCMKGRTLYVIPYCMGPIDSPYSRCGVEITDSAYVAINMILMTRVGRAALQRIHADGVLESEEEDEPVGPGPDVEHAAVPAGAPIAGAAYRAMQLDSVGTSASPFPTRLARPARPPDRPQAAAQGLKPTTAPDPQRSPRRPPT